MSHVVTVRAAVLLPQPHAPLQHSSLISFLKSISRQTLAGFRHSMVGSCHCPAVDAGSFRGTSFAIVVRDKMEEHVAEVVVPCQAESVRNSLLVLAEGDRDVE